jgi:anti-anti-sigma factor
MHLATVTQSPMTALSYPHIRSDSMTALSCSAYLTEDHRFDFRRTVFNALDAATAAGDPAVILDLSGVVAMDASGLGVLILLQKRARERGQRVRLLSVPSVVQRFFEDTRLGPMFDIVRSA